GGHQAVGVASYRVEAGLAYGRLVDFGKDLTISINLDQIVSELIESIIPIRIIGKGLTVYAKAGHVENDLGAFFIGQLNGHATELYIGNSGVRILSESVPPAEDVINVDHIDGILCLIKGSLVLVAGLLPDQLHFKQCCLRRHSRQRNGRSQHYFTKHDSFSPVNVSLPRRWQTPFGRRCHFASIRSDRLAQPAGILSRRPRKATSAPKRASCQAVRRSHPRLSAGPNPSYHLPNARFFNERAHERHSVHLRCD